MQQQKLETSPVTRLSRCEIQRAEGPAQTEADLLGLKTRDTLESQNETCLFIDSSLSLS